MAEIAAKIVLTGGPCGGKTTALSKIEEHFTELGYKVCIVGESATEVMRSGIKCIGEQALDLFSFQELLLKYQLFKEKMYIDAVNKLNIKEKCIIIFDRGVMDNNAYLGNEQFDYMIQKNNYTKLNLLDRYDLVIHLVTAALGAESFYTLENNEVRSEKNLSDAIAADYRTLNAWRAHSNLLVVDNSNDFETKIASVISSIENQLGINKRVRKQRKYLVELSNINFLKDALAIDIEQIYLGNDSYEKRLRKRTLSGTNTYYLTVQNKDLDGIANVYLDKRISEDEYYQLLSMYDEYKVIRKVRYCFIQYNKQFKLDIFEDGKCILESSDDVLDIPNYINIKEDITNDKNFDNNSLAQKVKILNS